MDTPGTRSLSARRGHLVAGALALVVAAGSATITYASAEPPADGGTVTSSTIEAPPTTGAGATEPATSAPAESGPETTVPATTVPPTSAPAAGVPATTASPTSVPAATEPPSADKPPVPSAPATVIESTTTSAAPEPADFDGAPSSATVPTTIAAPAVAGDDVVGPLAVNSTVEVAKTADVPGGGPVQPGMEFAYQLYVACTSTEVDCDGFVFTDVIPEDLEIVQLPVSNAIRTVAYDPGTRTLTMTYNQATDNPPGTGWTAGAQEAFDIVVRLPADTLLESGETITNEGVVTVNGAPGDSDDATVEVEIPVAVTPVASKQWPGGGVIAGSAATTTATIGAANASSGSAGVTSLAVVDTSASTWEHFDLTAVELTALPQGATQAQLFVCTQAASACGDDDWVPGGTATDPGPLSLPGGVAAGTVTGVRVEFTAGGAPLPRAPQAGGAVRIDLQLRDTFRSDGDTIAPDSSITVTNCASATASVGADDPVESGDSCANQQILSSNLDLTSTKVWVPDTNGNWEQNPGESAVAGAQSRVTARVRVVNQSAVPLHQIVIEEPGSSANDFDSFDVDRIRLTFPNGATAARVQVTYADGTTTDVAYAAAQQIDLDASTSQVTNVVVTYTGGTAAEPAIAPGSTAGLDLHGALTPDVDAATTLTNCADVIANPDGASPVDHDPCGNLPVQARNLSGQGIKTASQSSVPEDQPVTFTLRINNNGNLPLVDPVLTDPADPAASSNPFDDLTLISASVPSGAPTGAIEVWSGGSWQPYDPAAIPPDVRGVRLSVEGDVNPGQYLQLNITVERRPDTAATEIVNCFGATVANDDGSTLTLGANSCVTVSLDDADNNAELSKNIIEGQLPEWTPGMTRQETGVELRVANTGNLSSRYLQITDNDADFFDAVDFVRFGTITLPAGANRVQIDALVTGVWVVGDPTPVGAATLPDDVDPDQVRGLRFTFTSTSPGFVLAPCAAITAGCAGVIRFDVSPRPGLVSAPDTAPGSPLVNTITGSFETTVDAGQPQAIDPAADSFELVPGEPQIDVEKGPQSTVLGPGSTGTQTITVTNNGTLALTEVSLIDVLPPGLAFDEALGPPPYAVAVTGLPEGYDAAPDPSFEITRVDGRVASVRWTFGGGWALPPNGSITITFQVGLEPGVVTGETITNTFGATASTGDSGNPIACTPPDAAVDGDEQFGPGVYCTDTADTEVIAGAAFVARKWVAGDPDLGWWHPTEGFVDIGHSNCPSTDIAGRLYTATPCVALVERGGQFDYALRVINGGTEAATKMALVDNFPHQGDSGLIGGVSRGTEWNNRPTLAGPATFSGPGTGTLSYSSAAPGTWCTADLDLTGPGCADGWSDSAGSATTAMRLIADFATAPLNPGDGIEIRFTMNVPDQIDQDSAVTIAWNAFAHAEATRTASGGERVLPPIEPIKVGVSPLLPPPPASTTTTTSTTVPGASSTTVPGAPTTTAPAGPASSTTVPVAPGPTITTTPGLLPPAPTTATPTTSSVPIAGGLPRTGADSVRIVWIAAGLLAAGVLVVGGVRRRPEVRR